MREAIEVLSRSAVPTARTMPRPSADEADAADVVAYAVLSGYVLQDVQERGLKAAEACRARLGSFRSTSSLAATTDEELARLLADAETINLLKSSGRVERAQKAAAQWVHAAFADVPGEFPGDVIQRCAQAAATVAGLRRMAQGLASPAHIEAVTRHVKAIRAARRAGRPHAPQDAFTRRDFASAAIAAALARAAALRFDGRLRRLHGTLELIAGQVREGRVHAGPSVVPDAQSIRERVEQTLNAAADERRTRAVLLAAQLAARLRPGGPPALIRRPPAPDCLAWLRAGMNDGLYSRGDDLHTLHWLGGDPFGLRVPPPPPPFLADADFAAVRPEHVASFLRRLSLSGEAPEAVDLNSAPLESAPLSVAERDETQRRWGRAEDSGAPLLDPVTRIPRVMHSIWLGEPPPLDSEFIDNVGYAARRYKDEIDYVLWTDIPRSAVIAHRRGADQALGQRARDLLEWARDHGVLLVNISEVFHQDAPMVMQAEYVVEMSKQRPHGYAAASDILRLEIIERFGGFYIDGDLRLAERGEGAKEQVAFESLPELIDRVAASELGFTMDPIPKWANAVNNDLVIAPAGHPAIRLWLEETRLNYLVPQSFIVGGLDFMAKRLRGMELHAMRYLAPYRTGRVHHKVLARLGLTGNDLPATQPPILYWSTCSWIPMFAAKPASPGDAPDVEVDEDAKRAEIANAAESDEPSDDVARPDGAGDLAGTADAEAAPIDDEAVIDLLINCVTFLDWQLRAREGNLYLSTLEPVIRRLPDPDAAWTAILIALSLVPPSGSELADRYRSVAATVTSVTYRRRADDGTSFEHVALPPEAVAMFEAHRAPSGWLGARFSTDGKPVWLLDECVRPAFLRDARDPTPGALTVAAPFAEVALDLLGRPLGVWFGPHWESHSSSDSSARREGSEIYDLTTLPEGRFGLTLAGTPDWSWVGEPALRPETMAPLLLAAGAAGRTILMSVPYGTAGAARECSTALSGLLGQPVEVIEGPLRPPGRPLDPVALPSTRVPYREWAASRAAVPRLGPEVPQNREGPSGL